MLRAMGLRCLFGMIRRVNRVGSCCVSVVRRLLVMASLMMLGGLAMVPSRMTVMFRRLLVVFCCLLGHDISSKRFVAYLVDACREAHPVFTSSARP